MTLSVEIDASREGVVVAALHGRMTHGASLSTVEAQLRALFAHPGTTLILDLTAVDYADSAGLGLLVFLNGMARESGGSLRIAGANQRLREVINLTRVSTLLTLDSTREASLALAGA
jgi:anti-sigma B factor antagonist